MASLRRCYRRLLNEDPRAAGSVEVRFIVHTSGRVVSALVFRSTLSHPETERCIRAAIKSVTVEPGDEVTIVRAVLRLHR
jgi:outer membrane biosynthesis protein TonB